MNTQISLKLPDKLLNSAKHYADVHGFSSLQDLIRELLRKTLFEEYNETLSGLKTAIASETSLAKSWMSKEEDAAWAHLQKEM